MKLSLQVEHKMANRAVFQTSAHNVKQDLWDLKEMRMNFLISWMVTAVACAAAIWIVPGVSIDGGILPLIMFALVFALINASIKPFLQLISFPITVLTLGFFYLVVNTVLLYLSAWLANVLFGAGVNIYSFGSALIGSIVISIVSSIVNGIVGPEA